MLPVEPYTTPIRIPHIPTNAVWINSPVPLDPGALHGRVLLFDIWDYTCINCLRTLPYLREWYSRYQDLDFTLVGIHTPEFPFAKKPENVQQTVKRLGIRWPVILDNDQAIWTSFANRYWPTKYLADREGYLRYRHAGEGQYHIFENALQEILLEGGDDLDLPDIMEPVRDEDHPGAVCLPTTPELQADSLGNPLTNQSMDAHYSLPSTLNQGEFYLEGDWIAVPHGHKLRSASGRILLKYEASRCNAVLSVSTSQAPSSVSSEFIPIEIFLDESPLPQDHFAEDIFASDMSAILRVDIPRMYSITRHLQVEVHTLSLNIKDPGLVFYAFSFESCASVQTTPQSNTEV
jgi:thiol-disulfide isomerase/thioredoxin